MLKQKIIIISVGRSDYDRYYPLLNELNRSKAIELFIFATKSHHDLLFGKTINFIDKKFKILKQKYKSMRNNDLPVSFSQDLIFLNKKIKNIKPHKIIVLGDRYEMLLGPVIAIPNNIPIIHLYGGAVTEGATDELVRHAITKMSHFHLVLLQDYKKRLLQMGEESWRIKVIGLHELNYKKKMLCLSKKNLSKKFRFDLSKPYCLLTFHPVTLELNKLEFQLNNLFKALKKTKINIVITYPNADPEHEKIIKLYNKFFLKKKNYLIVKNLGMKNYVSILKHCEFVIGNSSSGIVEAGSFKKPAINIGSRQEGKIKPLNVIDSKYTEFSIVKSIKRASTFKFKKKIKKMKNPYESSMSIQKVANEIIRLKVNDKLLRKKFLNL